MTSYTEDEEEEDAYNLRRRGLQLATSIDCIRIDKKLLTEFNGQSLIIIDMPARGGAPIGAGGHDPPLFEAKGDGGHNLGIIH